MFGNVYSGRSAFLTGHTGFKGSWLAHWLDRLGCRVTGFGLDPASNPNHWDLIAPQVDDRRDDIRDVEALRAALHASRPEVIFHLAAQPLVRRSYRDPLETWSTNVLGTANLLEACRDVDGLRAIVVVTTDKVYANHEWPWGYRESDALGGYDAYSASKAAAEIVVASYRQAFFDSASSPLVATARAGNVIGGGDWSEDRLIPDLVRAVAGGEQLEIRSPRATRPWQHVLETLAGYLLLGQLLLEGRADVAEAWNFGPDAVDNRAVEDVLTGLRLYWPELAWHQTGSPQVHEANLLYLDSSKARTRLKWQPVWPLDRALERTAEWYRTFYGSGAVISGQQLDQYIADAKLASCAWAAG